MEGHNDFDGIISMENLLDAWHEFKRGKGTKTDVLSFGFALEDNLFALHRDLKRGAYRPDPYETFYVCDPKLRHIHKASVRDRVLHQALYRKLYEAFDKRFIHDSYSCRLYKGTHRGVRRLADFVRKASKNHTRTVWYLKCDIAKFFDNIDHGYLKEKLAEVIQDPRVLKLCDQIIQSFEKVAGKGLPLGNVTSQLFANVYMDAFDQFMKRTVKEKYYIRYCDDFVILHEDKGHLLELLSKMRNFLQKELGLSMHGDKIILKKASQGIDFLGYVVFPYYRVVRTRTKRRMYRKLARKLSEEVFNSYRAISRHAYGHRVRRELERIYLKTEFRRN